MSELSVDRRALLLGTILAAAAAAFPARGAELDRLSIVIGTIPGSILDTVGRAFGKLAEQSLAVEVRNLEGATSLLAFKDSLGRAGDSNLLYFLQGALLYQSLSDRPENATLGAEMSSVSLIGSLGADRRAVFAAAKLGFGSFADLVAYDGPLIVPTVTAGSGSYFETLIVNTLTGSRLKPVGGYSSAERKLAILSGEANVVVSSVDSFSELVADGVIVPLLRLNDRGPDAPHADQPLLADVASGPDADTLVDLVAGVANTNNIVIAPPGLSAEQVAALTTLFEAVALRLAETPDENITASEAIAFSRSQTVEHIGTIFADRAKVAAAFNRAQACGAQLADGKACV